MDIIVTSSLELDRVLDYVHDRYFDLDAIKYDRSTNDFCIPLTVISERTLNQEVFAFWRKWKNPIYDAKLIVSNVLEVNIKDDAQIGEADINRIHVVNEKLVIECGIPVKISLVISELKMILRISDTVVGHRKRFAFGRSFKSLGSE